MKEGCTVVEPSTLGEHIGVTVIVRTLLHVRKVLY